LLHDLGIDLTLFRGDALMPDDAHVHTLTGDDGAAMAAVVIARDGIALPELGEARVRDGLCDGRGVIGDTATRGTTPLGPVGEQSRSDSEG
jgi:hypothetical protein